MLTHYDVLHVKEDATPEVIRAAYKALAQKWHPDKYPDDRESAERQFKVISEAYETLSNIFLRSAYDAELKAARSDANNAPPPKTEPDLDLETTHTLNTVESTVSRLWQGRVPIWKLVWLYMLGLPLVFVAIEVTFSRDNGFWTFIVGSAVLIVYLAFIHICLWKTIINGSAITRIVGRAYFVSLIAVPLAGVAVSQIIERQERRDREISRAASDDYDRRAQAETQRLLDARDRADREAEERRKASEDLSRQGHQEAKARFDRVLTDAYKKYPFLNSDLESANPMAIDEVLAETRAWIAKGYGEAESLEFAVNKIAPKYQQ